jgi:hypothetical protein
VTDENRSTASLRPMMALVFASGFLMTSYGLFFELMDGALLRGLAWTVGGWLLQVASGARDHRTEARTGLTNPFAVLAEGMRKIRHKVRGWDERE